MQAKNTGLELSYTSQHVLATAAPGTDYLYPYVGQMIVGVSGLDAPEATTYSYSDWTVTAEWIDGNKTMYATLGHGLPFVYFEINGGDAAITFLSSPSVWYNQNGVLGVTVDGRHYGIFAPTGSIWNTNGTFTSELNGKDYLSVALLPDNSISTLELYTKRAYAFVTNSFVEWNYNESTSEVTSTYNYVTTLKDSADGNLNETISALYRHQYLHLNETSLLTDFRYASSRGR